MSTQETTASGSDLLTVRDTAARLALHPETVRRLIRQGLLPAITIGGSVRVDPAVLDLWLAEQATPREAA